MKNKNNKVKKLQEIIKNLTEQIQQLKEQGEETRTLLNDNFSVIEHLKNNLQVFKCDNLSSKLRNINTEPDIIEITDVDIEKLDLTDKDEVEQILEITELSTYYYLAGLIFLNNLPTSVRAVIIHNTGCCPSCIDDELEAYRTAFKALYPKLKLPMNCNIYFDMYMHYVKLEP